MNGGGGELEVHEEDAETRAGSTRRDRADVLGDRGGWPGGHVCRQPQHMKPLWWP